MQTLQRRKKARLGIQNRDVVAVITWTFSMQIQNHSALLHCTEYRIKDFVIHDSGAGVGCDTSRVGLDAYDALSFGSFDDCWGDLLVKISGCEISKFPSSRY